MKRILLFIAMLVFSQPAIAADDKAKLKELEDRLAKVEAAISWKTTESKVTHKAEGPFDLGTKPSTFQLKAVGCQCTTTGVCTCGNNCNCNYAPNLTINGVPHVFVNGSYHPEGKVSTAPPLSSSALFTSQGVRADAVNTAQFMPQYHGGMNQFSQQGCVGGNCSVMPMAFTGQVFRGGTCANGRCGR